MPASAWIAPPTDDVGTVTTANVRFLADKSDCELLEWVDAVEKGFALRAER